ncbi:MAG: bifunctional adenosylcobinamide kinase/adenosylcobinamide-phosphate guanylyltransferase [Nitrospirota bacterium]
MNTKSQKSDKKTSQLTTHNSRLIFITGGVRSGKSEYAMSMAEVIDGRKAFIATAESLDDEMAERIKRHRERRNQSWDTYEAPLDMYSTLRDISENYSVILIDCITLWLSNLILSGKNADNIFIIVDEFLRIIATCNSTVIVVSNEVGWGIVPDNRIAREFRDTAGRVNQMIASAADSVYMVISGIPLRLK